MTFKAETFSDIAGRKGHSGFARSECPDQFVGVINCSPKIEPMRVFDRQEPSISRGSPRSAVIIILESPHTSEYVGETAIGPANGRSGDNIRKHLPDCCPQLSSLGQGERPLILMNAIQFQCSLGAIPARYRDAVFLEAWEAGAKEDFTRRLQTFYREGDFVINACTAGNTKPPLRELVERCVIAAAGRPSDLRTYHPATWGRISNTARKYGKPVKCDWEMRR